MDVTRFCSESTVLVVVGKGGVGKTTASAALARVAVRNHLSVLVVGLDKRSGLGATLGRSANVRFRTLSPEDALIEYLVDRGLRPVAKRLVNSRTLDLAATALPGVRDVLVLGQIVQLEQARTADLIVVDGPAAGRATTFLTSARGLLDSARGGPMRTRTAEVVEFLSDPARCRAVLVTLAEETPVNETVETAFNLEHRVGVRLAPVIVNDVYARLDHLDADPNAAAEAAGVILRPGEGDAMRTAATFRRRRQEMQAEQSVRLAAALPLPQVRLPHLRSEEIGPPEVDLLADALEREIVELCDVAGRARRSGTTGAAATHRASARAATGPGRSS